MAKRASLRNKITTAIVLVILLLGLTVTFAINQTLPNAVKDEAKKRGISMARSLAVLSSKPLLFKESSKLKILVDEEKAASDDVAYAFIMDTKGNVLAHTFISEEVIPAQLKTTRSDSTDEMGDVSIIDSEKGIVYDITAPILSDSETIGMVRIGIQEENTLKAINNILGIVIGTTLLTIILSMFIGSGLAGLIVRPVNKLRKATEEMMSGNLDVRVDIKTGDEIQNLASSFNQMAIKLKDSYESLLKSNQELEKAYKVKSDFLAIMSHELRTPLTAIIGFSEMIIEGVTGEIKDEQKDMLNEVLHNAADLLDMINSLLDFTKLESGRMKLDITNFNISQTLRRACTTISPLTKDKGLQLNIDIPEGMPVVVEGDERKIQRAVLNLLANATKFTPKHGHVSLKARHFTAWNELADKDAIQRYVERPEDLFHKGGVLVIVEDNGIGIPSEYCDTVFDMFYQVEEANTRSYGGIGLGLALAKQFVEMHSGRIWVESETGKGAKFTIVIPCKIL
ncbi:MAG: ATP-binding protein [Pseudomonadota bacterium]